MTEIKDVYTFKVGEKEITIVMYAGLLRKLITVSKMLTDPEAFVTDMEVQEKFVDLLLTEFDEKGKEVGKFADAFMLPTETIEDLTVWGYNHCLNFTLNTSGKLKKMMDEAAQRLVKDSQPTAAG